MAELFKANNKARTALANAERSPDTPPEKLDALRQQAQATQAAVSDAQGPPPKPTNIFGGPNVGGDVTKGYQSDLDAHQAAVDARAYSEGSPPVPDPGAVGGLFRMGGDIKGVVRGTDPEGNAWVGTGNAMVRGPALDRSVTAINKLKTTPAEKTVPPDAISRVTKPDPNVDYQPVNWGRKITLDGQDQVVGQRADGTHVVLHKAVYDTLHAAAGPDGTVVSGPGPKGRKSSPDDRLFAKNAQGETVGVGMPIRSDEARAKTWMHGPEDVGIARDNSRPETLADRATGPGTSGDQDLLASKGPGGPRIGGRKTPFEGPPRVTAEADPVNDYKFNNGTSVWRSVFGQAGHDPDLAKSLPIERQNKILTDHMKNTFGFKNVELAPDAKGMVDQKVARDAMLDMTRATQDMMGSLAYPYEAASLNGKLNLVFDPRGKRAYHGMFSTNGQINLAGGANSFGHEWSHAVDHDLAERAVASGRTLSEPLLSRAARQGELNPKDDVERAFARVMNTMFYDKAAEETRRVALQGRAAKTDRQGNPTQGALDAQEQIDRLDKAASNLKIQPTEFRANALANKKSGYYSDPAEMLARAHEAWIARQMQNDGADPRGAVMPDAAYIRETSRRLAEFYPQDDDRANIFSAFDDLHAAMRREDVLGQGKTPQGKSNLSLADPLHYPTTVPPDAAPADVAEMGGIVNKMKNGIRGIFSDSARPDPEERPLWKRAADYSRALTYSHHGIMETIIARAPKSAQPLLRDVMDRLAAAPGEGRYTGETMEEAVRRRARGWTGRFANILRSAGYKSADHMSDEEGEMLRHALTTGENTYPTNPDDLTGTGPRKPIPQNLITAAGRLRDLMDEAWDATDKSGIDIGYARSGYYPRLYDALKITASRASKDAFAGQAAKLHSLMFDRELGAPGSDPEALMEKWTTLSKADQKAQPNGPEDQFTLEGHMNELKANLKRQGEINEQLQAGPDPALEAELAQRRAEATTMAEAAHPLLRDHTAQLAANNWLSRIMAGGTHDFDTTGPTGKYLQARTLPPEADQLMRPFMRTDPADALPNYFHSAARRIAYAERFGANGEDLDAIMKKVTDNRDMNTHDANWFLKTVNDVTGAQNTGASNAAMKISNGVQAMGAMAMMPRAMWSGLSEPMNAALATGSMRPAFETVANQMGQIFHTASAKERTEMAEYLTTVTSPMHDSVMLSRMGADYSDSPPLNNFMQKYYRVTGLTALTNSQRIAATAASHGFLAKLARDQQGTNVNKKDDATRWMGELGLPPEIHDDFAKWMTDLNGARPTVAQLQTDPMAGAYGLATRRLVDRMIQDPYKVDKAAMAGTPFGGLPFQLMSFNYQFQRNVLQPMMDHIGHAYTRGVTQAQAGGAGGLSARLQGTASGLGSTMHAAAGAGAMIAAGVLTTALRQYLFAPDQVQKHIESGDLGDYFLDLAMQRSGLNGTLDPLIQLETNLRYDANVSSLLQGASVNYLAKNLMDVINPFVMANDSPNSNTRYWNAAHGAFNLAAVPAAVLALTGLGGAGGKLFTLTAGAGLQYLTSPAFASKFADWVAGPKGAELDEGGDGLPSLPDAASLPDLPSLGGGGPRGQGAAEDAGGSGIPWGLMDDVAKPAWEVAGQPIVNALARLPRVVKGLGAVTAAAYGVKKFLDTTEPWRGQPPPTPKEAPQNEVSP